MAGQKYSHLPLANRESHQIRATGRAVLDNPFTNKGTAFSHEERHTLKLHGLLPTNVQTLQQQADRAYQQYSGLDSDLEKNTFMTSMAEQNIVLYYRLIQDHLTEMSSIIYTPTEGEAIENYSRVFRRPTGCFLPITHKDEVGERLSRFVVEGEADGGVDYIVVSDGQQILGIGDQGIGGILISTAKLVLTTVCAGVHPDRTLPVVLDVGTDNEKLLGDELYLGVKQNRKDGEEYDDFVESFVKEARRLFPRAYIHFEDFGVKNARRLLDRYRGDYPVFNDDVQGTGCVTLASIMAAAKVSGVAMKDLRVLSFGAGSAGTGIAEQVAAGIASDKGCSKEEAMQQIYLMDKQGLLLDSDNTLTVAQQPFAHKSSKFNDLDLTNLTSVIQHVRPHILIGTSTKPKAFTREAVTEMAKHVDRPIIFPLSNPTRLHEAQPKDLLEWTDGKALIATGSPFPPVEHNGEKFIISECNNSVCFPGIGLGCVLGRVKKVTDEMLVAAVQALALQAPAVKDGNCDGKLGLCPDFEAVREVSVEIACAVLKQAKEEELLGDGVDVPVHQEQLRDWVKAQMWSPEYKGYEVVGEAGR